MQSKGKADIFIRGGQTTQHWVRMGGQVGKTALIAGAIVLCSSWLYLASTYYRAENFWLMWAGFQANFNVQSHGTPDVKIRFFYPGKGWVTQTAAEIFNDEYVAAVVSDYEARAVQFLQIALAPTTLTIVLIFVVYYFAGKDLEGDSHVRGARLVKRSELIRWSRWKWQLYERTYGRDRKKGSRYTIAGIEFPPNAVEAQTAICGTVGTGKSNAIRELLATVRTMNGKAIVYDRMGTFVEDFYDETRDIIINPFDRRSRAWSPFAEADKPEFFAELADVFIPDQPASSDQFWVQSARLIFDYAAQSLFRHKKLTNKDLRDAILNISAEELADLVANTPGAHFFNKDIAKTTGSIRANLITELRFLEYLRDDAEPFSIRDWVKDDDRKGFVFLTGDAEHQAATRNIISAIFEVAANALMASGQSTVPRVWFILDEVPTLNKMPFLSKSLAQIRQFGGAFVVGYQVFSQLEEIYGDKGARTIAGNLNNRVIFNTPDADTAEIFSKSLGSEDVEERRENITVGAHQSRDGVGFLANRVERRIVTASQIQSLAQFEAYISFAYDSPTAFVRFKPLPVKPQAHKFVPYHGRSFAEGEMRLLGQNEKNCTKSPLKPATEHVRNESLTGGEYEAYREHLRQAGQQHLSNDPENGQALFTHFLAQRAKGLKPSEIGLPALSGHMMAGTNQRKMPAPPVATSVTLDAVSEAKHAGPTQADEASPAPPPEASSVAHSPPPGQAPKKAEVPSPAASTGTGNVAKKALLGKMLFKGIAEEAGIRKTKK